MSDVIEIYYWEGDPDAEDLLQELENSGVPFEGHTLDAEIPTARPYVDYKGKTYWTLDEFRQALENGA